MKKGNVQTHINQIVSRYFIKADGQIVFSGMHATIEGREKQKS